MPSSRFSPRFATFLAGLACLAASRADAGESAENLVKTYCHDCHSGDAREGNFSFDALTAEADSPAARAQWRKVWKMVRQEFMPPAGSELLSREDRKTVVRWIEREPLSIDHASPDPGRVTMRRLNRIEYEATVNDLFGIDVAAAEPLTDDAPPVQESRLRDMLPPDDTAFGFDNNGDFQTLSPALLEKYFTIAEYIVSKVVVTDGRWRPVDRVYGRELKSSVDHDAKRVEQVGRFYIARPGRYRVELEFSLGGWQEYGGGFDFAFDVDAQRVVAEPIDIGGHKTHRHQHEAEFAKGSHTLTLATKATKPDSNGHLLELKLNPSIRVVGPLDGDEKFFPEVHKRIFFEGEPPADPTARRDYAKRILDRLASRAFRRPVDPQTLERLTELATSEENFELGVSKGVLAILTSGRFLFRTELQPRPDDPAQRHELDEFALAARLSYFLWLSLPDEELTRLAAAGELRKNLPAQLTRMLADKKADRFLEDFAGQWLRTRNILMTALSKGGLEDGVRRAMKRETEMLFEHVVRNDRDLMELVTADYTFLNSELAEFYGLPAVEGRELRRVELPRDSHRGGVLTHGSFLASTSNPDRTSPVKRGLFVLENLLATQPPPPPPNVPTLEEAKIAGKSLKTVREQLEVHRADASCAACHAHFDPIGVVLENFDLAGRWRTTDQGEPIDPTAEAVTGERFSGVDDLKNYIAGNRERFYGCVAEKLLTYALGRGLEPYDFATVDRVAERVAADGGKFSTLLREVVESPAFQTRRGDDDAAVEAVPHFVAPTPPPPEKRKRRRRGPPAPAPVVGEAPAANPPAASVPANPSVPVPASSESPR